MSLWSLEALGQACDDAKITGVKADPAIADDSFVKPKINGVSIDSRSLVRGDLFIALNGDPGPRFNFSGSNMRDGHEFIAAAIKKGAAAIMYARSQSQYGQNTNTPAVAVDDTLDGLWQLGAYARKRVQGKICAITGSSGKTTVKQWLAQILAKQAATHASMGSLNNHWGVPLSLARMPSSSHYGIFEIGTNHAGEISPLATLVQPDVALVLNVLPAHIGNFTDMAALQAEKLSIVNGLKEAGVLILPATLAKQKLQHKHLIRFGLASEHQRDNIEVLGKPTYHADYTHVDADVCGTLVDYRINVGGEHRVLSSLAVMALVEQMGGDLQRAANDFYDLSTPAGRGNTIQINQIKIIDDSYNANPVSMRYAIEAMLTGKKHQLSGRKIAILGEMLELGDTAKRAHIELAQLSAQLDGFITVGDGFKDCPGNLGHYQHADEIDIQQLTHQLQDNDCILIKGANKVFWHQQFVNKLVGEIGK